MEPIYSQKWFWIWCPYAHVQRVFWAKGWNITFCVTFLFILTFIGEHPSCHRTNRVKALRQLKQQPCYISEVYLVECIPPIRASNMVIAPIWFRSWTDLSIANRTVWGMSFLAAAAQGVTELHTDTESDQNRDWVSPYTFLTVIHPAPKICSFFRTPLSVWPHLFCGAGHEKSRGEQLKWSLAFRLYTGSFSCAQLPGPVHTAWLSPVCFLCI